MEIYIEYALIENFLIDGALLYLSLKTARNVVRWKRLVLSALVGAVFAVLYPLIPLPKLVAEPLKFAFGAILVRLAKTGKGWDRFAFTALCFYFYSFLLGGAMLGFYGGEIGERAPVWGVGLGLFVLVVLALWAVKRVYRRRATESFLYDCKITIGGRSVNAKGFLDSGNTATASGKPLCFITPPTAKKSPGPLCSRSYSALLKPSVHFVINSRRESASRLFVEVMNMHQDLSFPLPILPRS